jgi:hypothetical protein
MTKKIITTGFIFGIIGFILSIINGATTFTTAGMAFIPFFLTGAVFAGTIYFARTIIRT